MVSDNSSFCFAPHRASSVMQRGGGCEATLPEGWIIIPSRRQSHAPQHTPTEVGLIDVSTALMAACECRSHYSRMVVPNVVLTCVSLLSSTHAHSHSRALVVLSIRRCGGTVRRCFSHRQSRHIGAAGSLCRCSDRHRARAVLLGLRRRRSYA